MLGQVILGQAINILVYLTAYLHLRFSRQFWNPMRFQDQFCNPVRFYKEINDYERWEPIIHCGLCVSKNNCVAVKSHQIANLDSEISRENKAPSVSVIWPVWNKQRPVALTECILGTENKFSKLQLQFNFLVEKKCSGSKAQKWNWSPCRGIRSVNGFFFISM